MDRSGTVTVTLDRLPAAAGLRLTIGDEGCGMDERVRQRLFEPFFTTKPQGKGTRLGLAVVHGIVRGWRGTISVTSALGRGTSFEITLPVAESPTIEHPATESPSA
ncbi:sensor histidine kinase [Azospirillum doebereinerae]